MSGGPNTAEKVAAVRSTWLTGFSNTVIMADRDLIDLGVESPPSKFYCSTKDSRWDRRNLSVVDEWSARGRCTQQRFLYLLLRLREKYPDASFYALVDDDTWLNSVALKQLLSAKDPTIPFLMGHLGTRGRRLLWSGPGFIFSSELARRLDAATLMTQASLWEFSCSFRGCCDHAYCFTDDHPSIQQEFNACNSRLVQTCGNMSTTELYESCIGELAKNDDNNCEYEKTMPEFPVPMYFEPEWVLPGQRQAESLREKWSEHHGCDHVLSLAARQVGGQLVDEPRLVWTRKRFEEYNQYGIGPYGKDVCAIISQHHLVGKDLVRWHQKWNAKCQT